MKLIPVRPKILSCRLIPNVDQALAKKLGCDLKKHTSIGIITCDQDDSLYVALDHATKFAAIDVVYAKSFYAGAAHSSGPLSGEIMGVIAGADPDDVAEGLWALRQSLAQEICFYSCAENSEIAFFPQVIPSIGHYLSKEAGVEPETSMAYLIAPPAESVVGIDHALKSARVELVRYFGPPTETNFGGAYLIGELPEVEAAAQAFSEAIIEVARHPLEAARRPMRLRR